MQSTPALNITPAPCEHASSCSTCPSEASTSPSTTSASTTPFSSVPVTPADELSDELFPMDSAIKGDVSSTLHSALRREKDKDSVEANVKGLLGRSGSLTRAARRAKEVAKTGLKMLKKVRILLSLHNTQNVEAECVGAERRRRASQPFVRFDGYHVAQRAVQRHSVAAQAQGNAVAEPTERREADSDLQYAEPPHHDRTQAAPQQERMRGVSGSASAKSLARTHTPTPSKLQLVSTAESTAPSLASLPRSPAALLRVVLFPLT
ncbi:hypothetical protein EWM64_g5331 [Hericium alpestre]|uniref:Uncharacterized protein n=1 Tax=Hericium alpestre TaxID=135208 RepID=A0A4Y9ZX89_9AGAM|nr:hypothetical protein EWM64_g5331 [Hericium alpestre]